MGIFLREIGTFCLLARRLLFHRISAPQLTLLFTKNAHTATTAVTLPVFLVSIAISSALMLLLGDVLTTLVGQA
jgi:hypothetical protein